MLRRCCGFTVCSSSLTRRVFLAVHGLLLWSARSRPQASVVVVRGFSCWEVCESSWTRDQVCRCAGSGLLNHWTSREVLRSFSEILNYATLCLLIFNVVDTQASRYTHKASAGLRLPSSDTCSQSSCEFEYLLFYSHYHGLARAVLPFLQSQKQEY